MCKERYINAFTDKFDEIPAALRNSLFERFFREAEIQAFSQEERMAYEISLKTYRDYNNTINTALEKGREEGREEGLAKGHEEGLAKGREEGERLGMIKVARALKAQGLGNDAISAATGLSRDEISRLL